MKFKVGDKVKVGKFVPQYEGDGYGELEWPEGLVGSIGDVVSGVDFPYIVEFENVDPNRTPNWFAEEELEAAA